MKDTYKLVLLTDVSGNRNDAVYPYPGFADLCNGCENKDQSLAPLPCKLVDFQNYGQEGWDFVGPDLVRRRNGIEDCSDFKNNPKIVNLNPNRIIVEQTARQKPPLGFPKP